MYLCQFLGLSLSVCCLSLSVCLCLSVSLSVSVYLYLCLSLSVSLFALYSEQNMHRCTRVENPGEGVRDQIPRGGSRVSGKIARGGPPILCFIAFLLTSFSKICLGGCCFIPPLPPPYPPLCASMIKYVIIFLSFCRTTISNNLGYGLAIWLNETTVNYPVRQETLLSYSNFSLNYDIGALVSFKTIHSLTGLTCLMYMSYLSFSCFLIQILASTMT
jgi:hypothetical protein